MANTEVYGLPSNATSQPLDAHTTYVGWVNRGLIGQVIHTTIFTDISGTLIKQQQSLNGQDWDVDQLTVYNDLIQPAALKTNPNQVINAVLGMPFWRVLVENNTDASMNYMRLITSVTTQPQQQGVNVRHLNHTNDTVKLAGLDLSEEPQYCRTTFGGDLIINGTGGSATRLVSEMIVGRWYRVAFYGTTTSGQWATAGALVGAEILPAIGRLFKCLSATSGSGSVYDVEYTDIFSAKRPVYLMDVGTWYRVASVGNTPGHVWTAIGAIVGGESLPEIGRLFKCLSAPANIEGQGTVYDVEYSDTVTATPVGTQDVNIVSTVTVPVSGSVALLPAVDPTLTVGTVRLNDAYGSPLVTTAGNLMVGINNIYTVNPLHTILDSGSVSVTGNVAVTNADITSIKTNTARFGLAIGSNYEESVINTYTNLSITGGYLYNLSVYSAGTVGINFLKVYGVAGATIADTPLLIVPVPAGQSVNLSLSGLKALTGISVRATTTWALAGNTSPSNPISCNLTFSPLV